MSTVATSPRVTWLGRTFGWSGSRQQWILLLAGFAWFAGLVLIWHYSQSRSWSIGESIFAVLGWIGVLGLVAHKAVRNLFGPVFLYDLLRISRNRFTFQLRGLYVLGLGIFLGLFYYDWLLMQSRYRSSVRGEFLLISFVVLVFISIGLFRLSRGQWHVGIRWTLLALGVILSLICLIAGIEDLGSAWQRAETAPMSMQASDLSRFAMNFFRIYAPVQFIVVCLLTPVYVAGTIAVEKEKKTLEFLLATDLRNREIVFGKVAARVVLLIMYVLAGLPLLAFLQLFGGIDPEQLLAATTATIVSILGLSAVSVWVSVQLRRARDAIVMTYLIVTLYIFLSLLLAVLMISPMVAGLWYLQPLTLLGVSFSLPDLFFFFADGNVIWSILKLEMAGQAGPTAGFTTTMAGVLRDYVIFWSIATVLFMLIAIARLRTVALHQAYGSAFSRRTRVRLHPKAASGTRSASAEPNRRNSSRPPIGQNPVLWKEVFVDSTFRGGLIGRLVTVAILFLLFAPLALIIYFSFIDIRGTWRINSSFAEQWHEFTLAVNGWVRIATGIVGFLILMAACMRGASAIIVEKDRDTWTSLMSTPLSSDDMLWGKFWGCLLSQRRAFAVLLLIWAIGLAVGAVMPGMMLVMLPLTFIYTSAYAWTGLYCSMTARTSMIASVRGFFAGLFLSGGFWIVLGLCCFLPLNFERDTYRTAEYLSSFFMGFVPPFVYGVFPLNGFDNRDLGPFEMDRSYSAGLAGPIIGTIFWIVYSVVMYLFCRSRFRNLTNRDSTTPRAAPARVATLHDQ